MSLMDQTLDFATSLDESRKFIRKVTRDNKKLATEAIEELESIVSFLSPITANPHRLLKFMFACNAAIVGIQATSFFYPITTLHDAPWDIFCHTDKADKFVDDYTASSGAEVVELVTSENGNSVMHLRRPVNGSKETCKIRIFVSDAAPIQSALDMKASYEQSIITPTCALCFWPKLMERRAYRSFSGNKGISEYPKGKTFYEIKLEDLKATRPRKTVEEPSVYSGITSRVESVVFENVASLNTSSFARNMEEMRRIMFAVHNSSTRYLGSTGNMV